MSGINPLTNDVKRISAPSKKFFHLKIDNADDRLKRLIELDLDDINDHGAKIESVF